MQKSSLVLSKDSLLSKTPPPNTFTEDSYLDRDRHASTNEQQKSPAQESRFSSRTPDFNKIREVQLLTADQKVSLYIKSNGDNQ